MTVSNTLRFLLKKFSSGGDPHPTREEHNEMIDSIENNAAMGAQGITSARPAAGKGRRFFWDETAQRMHYDDGAAWKDLNPNGGGGAGSAIVPGAAASEGASARAARADHTHSLPLATGSAHGALSSTDKAKLDNATAGATGNTLALRDANGRLSTNTPISAGHVTTKAYVDDLHVKAADYTDSRGVKVYRSVDFTGTSAASADLARIEIPDPGYPYYITAHATLYATTPSGTSYDVQLKHSGIWLDNSLTAMFKLVGNSYDVKTGASYVTVSAVRITGTGGLTVTTDPTRKFFTVMVHAA